MFKLIPPLPPGYPPLLRELWGKITGFASTKLGRLGTSRWRNFRLLNYALGALFLTYSTLNLLYDLNINFMQVVSIPFLDFFRQQLVPFLTYPFKYAGFDFGNIFGSLLSVSLIGGSLWANAEYRNGKYLHLYPFRKLQKRPGSIDFKSFGKLPPPQRPPPQLLSTRSALRIPHSLLLGYSMLGLLPATVGAISALWVISRYAWEFMMLFQVIILFACQRFLVRYERWGDDENMGTRLFLAFYRPYRDVDKRLNDHLRRHNLIFLTPRGPISALARDVVAEASRVAVLVLLILLSLFILFHLGIVPREPFRNVANE